MPGGRYCGGDDVLCNGDFAGKDVDGGSIVGDMSHGKNILHGLTTMFQGETSLGEMLLEDVAQFGAKSWRITL